MNLTLAKVRTPTRNKTLAVISMEQRQGSYAVGDKLASVVGPRVWEFVGRQVWGELIGVSSLPVHNPPSPIFVGP
jgi:hypothetical protein